MHRSGTSALTGVLKYLGFALPSRLMEPAEDNQTGFWESAELADIHDAAFASAGMQWNTPMSISPDWFQSEAAAAASEQILEVLERDFANCSLFAIKDPRICRLFPLWRSVLHQLDCRVRVIIPVRHPQEVVDSLVTRDRMNARRAQLLWLYHLLDAEKATRDYPRTFVHFHDLLADWRATIAQIEVDLGWRFPERSPEIEAAIDDFLQPQLRHHRVPNIARVSSAETIELVELAYEQLLRAHAGKPLDLAVMDEISRELIRAEQVFAETGAEAGAKYAELTLQVKQLEQLQATLMHQNTELERRFRETERQQEKLSQYNFQLEERLIQLQQSLSWRLTTPLRWMKARVQSSVSRFPVREDLNRSCLFDKTYYSQQYAKKIEALGLSPLQHFIQIGASQQCRPHPLFDIAFYCSCNPDVVASGLNPLWHYLTYGGAEGRKPHPLFDSAYYLRENPNVARAGLNPLEHYLCKGAGQRLNPCEFFDTNFYLQSLENNSAALQNPLLHFIQTGVREGRKLNVDNFQPLDWKVWVVLEQAALRRSLDEEAAALSFPYCDRPEVSILIPVFNKVEYTLQCLKGLMQQITDFPFEVIVADDASSDDSQRLLASVPGLQYRRNPDNLGFLRSCNRAARKARGRYLVLLNNDTVPLPNWLTEIVAPLQTDGSVGLVGSMLLYPDGRLQEAGGSIWQDGSGWNIGRLQEPQACDYQFVREVDYCSGAALALSMDLWQQLDGFDLRYAPAYYEDTDLAFRVRETGLKVIYTPFSQLVHFEGISSGTDLSVGVKRYQAINRSVFAERWKEQLLDRQPPDSPELATYSVGKQRQLLWIDALTPTPDRDSGSVDALNFLTVARQSGWEVSFIPASNLLRNGHYTKDLQRLGIRCLYWPYISSVEAYLQQYGHLFDVVVLSRVSVPGPLLSTVRQHAPQAAIAFNTVDLHFLRQQRQLEIRGEGSENEVKATRASELQMLRESDLTIAISEQEAEILRSLDPSATVSVVPIGRSITGRKAAFEQRRDICFLGGFQHDPNIDAVKYFIEYIWPLIAERLPDCKFLIAGSDIPAEIRHLEGDRIEILGYIPDLADLFERVRLSVAPLRFGAGMKGKVVSSLSHGVPVVASSIAMEGMSIGKYLQTLIADKPAAFADCVASTYTNQEEWEQLSQAALDCSCKQFSLEVVTPKIQQVFKQLFQLRQERVGC